VAAFSVASALAAMAPRPPAAAAAASSGPGGPGAGPCLKDETKVQKFPLVMCVERQTSTSTFVGNGFPWENSTGFFASFRNQYLFPSASVNKVKAISDTIDSIHSRSVTFSGTATHVYNSAGSGSFVRITDAVSDALVPQFSLNTGLTSYGSLTAPPGGSFSIDMIACPSGGCFLSSCSSCVGDADPKSASSRDKWSAIGDLTSVTNLLVDNKSNVGGGTGNGVWDTGSGSGCEAKRAFGSGPFINPNHLTTAYGVDSFDFVWVFQGLAGPPPATVEQQIAEIIRLLLTPEGLRCSFLDLTSGNGKIEDNPIAFPAGSGIDPISPQITTGGTITGDETQDSKRNTGWQHP
jgi:hypothetical protein